MGKVRDGLRNLPAAKKLWIGIGALALLSPLGLILPALFNADGAWGEWSIAEIERLVGFIPSGMKRSAGRWNAPMPDYAVPGQGGGLGGRSIGYLLTAIVGLVVTAGAVYAIARRLAAKPDDRKKGAKRP